MANQELMTVAFFTEPMSAQITAGMLNENGIPAAVFGGVSPYPQLAYGHSIEVKVNPEDYEAALKLIETPAPETDLDAE